jgi:hypothetical protein
MSGNGSTFDAEALSVIADAVDDLAKRLQTSWDQRSI